MSYDPTLFEGCAPYYARYRPRYPDELFEVIVRECELDGSGRLLDVGCGTGHVSLPLAKHFTEVTAIDPDASMLAEGTREASEKNIQNISWVRATAETLPGDLGRFSLATLGQSFHWMDQEHVARALAQMTDTVVLIGGGSVAAVAGYELKDEGHQRRGVIAHDVIAKWLGPERRAGAGTYTNPETTHEEILARAGFTALETFDVPWEQHWSIDSLIGMLYSTSFATKRFFGERAPEFEADVRAALLAEFPSETWTAHERAQVVLAR